MQASEYYLNIKLLEDVGGIDVPKYSKLASRIFSELYEKARSENASPTPPPKLFRSNGEPIEFDNSLTKQTRAFFAGLSWLAAKSIYYTLLARSLGCDLFLHPIRHAFQANFLRKMDVLDGSIYTTLINAMNSQAREAVQKITTLGQPIITSQPMPLFVAWLAKVVRKPEKFLEAAYELRAKEPFQRCRQQLIEIEDLIADEDTESGTKKMMKLLKGVSKEMNQILGSYGVSTPQGIPIAPAITVWNVSTKITHLPAAPKLDIKIPYPPILKKLVPPRGFNALYRSIVSDLSQIGKLGELYEIISARVVLDEFADAHGLKTEQRKFLGKSAHWKQPM